MSAGRETSGSELAKAVVQTVDDHDGGGGVGERLDNAAFGNVNELAKTDVVDIAMLPHSGVAGFEDPDVALALSRPCPKHMRFRELRFKR